MVEFAHYLNKGLLPRMDNIGQLDTRLHPVQRFTDFSNHIYIYGLNYKE